MGAGMNRGARPAHKVDAFAGACSTSRSGAARFTCEAAPPDASEEGVV